jgi:hypothetical protein
MNRIYKMVKCPSCPSYLVHLVHHVRMPRLRLVLAPTAPTHLPRRLLPPRPDRLAQRVSIGRSEGTGIPEVHPPFLAAALLHRPPRAHDRLRAFRPVRVRVEPTDCVVAAAVHIVRVPGSGNDVAIEAGDESGVIGLGPGNARAAV